MAAEVAGWIQGFTLNMLAAEVAAEQRRALQQRLRHQLREAEAEAAVSQDWALSMLAAEVAAEQRRALQQRLRHQIKEASGQLQEGAAEAGEAQAAV